MNNKMDICISVFKNKEDDIKREFTRLWIELINRCCK